MDEKQFLELKNLLLEMLLALRAVEVQVIRLRESVEEAEPDDNEELL